MSQSMIALRGTGQRGPAVEGNRLVTSPLPLAMHSTIDDMVGSVQPWRQLTCMWRQTRPLSTVHSASCSLSGRNSARLGTTSRRRRHAGYHLGNSQLSSNWWTGLNSESQSGITRSSADNTSSSVESWPDEFDKALTVTVQKLFDDIDEYLFEGTAGSTIANKSECQDWSGRFHHLRIIGQAMLKEEGVAVHECDAPSLAMTSLTMAQPRAAQAANVYGNFDGLVVQGVTARISDADDEENCEQVFAIDGIVEEYLAFDDTDTNALQTPTPRKRTRCRNRGLPPVTPNACVHDTVMSELFNHCWTEVVQLLKPILDADKAIALAMSQQMQVSRQSPMVSFPAEMRVESRPGFDAHGDMLRQSSTPAAALLSSATNLDNLQRLMTIRPLALRHRLSSAAMTAESRESTPMTATRTDALSRPLPSTPSTPWHLAATAQNSGNMPSLPWQGETPYLQLSGNKVMSAHKKRQLKPLERAKTPSLPQELDVAGEVLRGRRIYSAASHRASASSTQRLGSLLPRQKSTLRGTSGLEHSCSESSLQHDRGGSDGHRRDSISLSSVRSALPSYGTTGDRSANHGTRAQANDRHGNARLQTNERVPSHSAARQLGHDSSQGRGMARTQTNDGVPGRTNLRTLSNDSAAGRGVSRTQAIDSMSGRGAARTQSNDSVGSVKKQYHLPTITRTVDRVGSPPPSITTPTPGARNAPLPPLEGGMMTLRADGDVASPPPRHTSAKAQRVHFGTRANVTEIADSQRSTRLHGHESRPNTMHGTRDMPRSLRRLNGGPSHGSLVGLNIRGQGSGVVGSSAALLPGHSRDSIHRALSPSTAPHFAASYEDDDDPDSYSPQLAVTAVSVPMQGPTVGSAHRLRSRFSQR